MSVVRPIQDVQAMTQDQMETVLRSSAKALVADPTDIESSITFSLLNDYAVSKWLGAAARSCRLRLDVAAAGAMTAHAGSVSRPESAR